MYRTLRLCANGGGLEAIPDRPGRLHLERVRGALEAAGVPVLDARVMLIASLEPEVTISRSGRLLFKTVDEAAARRAMTRLAELTGVGAPPSRVPPSRTS